MSEKANGPAAGTRSKRISAGTKGKSKDKDKDKEVKQSKSGGEIKRKQASVSDFFMKHNQYSISVSDSELEVNVRPKSRSASGKIYRTHLKLPARKLETMDNMINEGTSDRGTGVNAITTMTTTPQRGPHACDTITTPIYGIFTSASANCTTNTVTTTARVIATTRVDNTLPTSKDVLAINN